MKGKHERHRILREVITENKLTSQEELSACLESKGMTVAQATLSRDIKELKIVKVRDEGGCYYRFAQDRGSHPGLPEMGMTAESIVSLEFSDPVAVMKTRPGFAAMLASIIDGHHLDEVVGTLAGDDTILLVARQGRTRDEVFDSLSKLFEGLDRKRVN